VAVHAAVAAVPLLAENPTFLQSWVQQPESKTMNNNTVSK
jgi:hypothetical protein